MGTTEAGSVAVKIVDVQHATRVSNFSKCLTREVECMRSLNHPNVVRYIQHVRTEYW